MEVQPQIFRTTSSPDIISPDIISGEVFPHWENNYPKVTDNWEESGWQNPHRPQKSCYVRTFYEWLRGDFNFRALNEQFDLPDWLMGVRAGFLTPTYKSGLWLHEQELHWRFVLHVDGNKVQRGAVASAWAS